MASSPRPTLAYADNNWTVAWPDDYRLLIKCPDETRSQTFRAETVAFHGDDQLTIATIDFLNLLDRERFHISASGVNGLAPISWEERLQQAHRVIKDAAAKLPDAAHPVVVSMDSITAQPIEWLWYPYLALGKLCILDGDPGVGKTLLVTQ